MVDTGPLRCINPLCEGPSELRAWPETPGQLRCETCGHGHAVGSFLRSYGKRTGQWVVLAAVLLSLYWSYPGTVGQVSLVAGGAVALLAVYRIGYQVVLQRRLEV